MDGSGRMTLRNKKYHREIKLLNRNHVNYDKVDDNGSREDTKGSLGTRGANGRDFKGGKCRRQVERYQTE